MNCDKIEKVAFSADGTLLLGVVTDGTRIKHEALSKDPHLLTQPTTHKVDVTVFSSNEAAGGLSALAQIALILATVFAGLFFLSRRDRDGGSPEA